MSVNTSQTFLSFTPRFAGGIIADSFEESSLITFIHSFTRQFSSFTDSLKSRQKYFLLFLIRHSVCVLSRLEKRGEKPQQTFDVGWYNEFLCDQRSMKRVKGTKTHLKCRWMVIPFLTFFHLLCYITFTQSVHWSRGRQVLDLLHWIWSKRRENRRTERREEILFQDLSFCHFNFHSSPTSLISSPSSIPYFFIHLFVIHCWFIICTRARWKSKL